jgi:hypothetical protein
MIGSDLRMPIESATPHKHFSDRTLIQISFSVSSLETKVALMIYWVEYLPK